MKTRLFSHFLVCILLFAANNLFSQTTDLIISEYGEGSSWNKFIEIYNGTGADIDLTGYYIEIAFDGDPWNDPTNNTINLSTTLTDGDVYIICHTSANATIQAIADIITGSLSFNGNDAVGLFSPASIIDVVGNVGENPGTGWAVAGTTEATVDHTLVRKPTVCTPNTNWTSSAGTTPANSEWIVMPNEDWSNLGSHSSTCGGVPVPLRPEILLLLIAFSVFFFRKKIL